MAGKKPRESFAGIVREMVSEGEDFGEVIGNLQLLGLSKGDAEKLFAIVETKSTPEVEKALHEMVRLKFETVKEAWQLKKSRRAKSGIRRRVEGIKDTKFAISALLREEAPEKIPVFRERVNHYLEALRSKEQARKNVLGFLLQLEKENLLRRHKSALRKAIGFFRERA
jgi:hypothetical protein